MEADARLNQRIQPQPFARRNRANASKKPNKSTLATSMDNWDGLRAAQQKTRKPSTRVTHIQRLKRGLKHTEKAKKSNPTEPKPTPVAPAHKWDSAIITFSSRARHCQSRYGIGIAKRMCDVWWNFCTNRKIVATLRNKHSKKNSPLCLSPSNETTKGCSKLQSRMCEL